MCLHEGISLHRGTCRWDADPNRLCAPHTSWSISAASQRGKIVEIARGICTKAVVSTAGEWS